MGRESATAAMHGFDDKASKNDDIVVRISLTRFFERTKVLPDETERQTSSSQPVKLVIAMAKHALIVSLRMDAHAHVNKAARSLSRIEWLLQLFGSAALVYLTLLAVAP